MASGADLVNAAIRITSSRTIPYAHGNQPGPNDQSPAFFDCSGLVEWVIGQFGLSLGTPPYTVSQWNVCKQRGTVISVAAAIATPGALLFSHKDAVGNPLDPPVNTFPEPAHAHVAISCGNGRTVEAMGKDARTGVDYGVGLGTAGPPTRWTHAALVPGLDGGHAPANTSSIATSTPPPARTAIRPFPGDAFPGAAHDVVLGWQVVMIAGAVLADTEGNRDGVFGPGMTANPLFLFGAVAGLTGVQFLSLGLMGEVLTRVYFESQGKRPYEVREKRNLDSTPPPFRKAA